MHKIKKIWTAFWMSHAGLTRFGRTATKLAGLFYPPYKARHALAKMNEAGYISPSASLGISGLYLGKHVFIGDNVTLFSRGSREILHLEDDVTINKDTIIEMGHAGSLTIGKGTTVQPRCQFSAYKGSIRIGRQVQIGPACAFYPYNHSATPDIPMKEQPLVTRGGITIEDDVWLGYGVIVLDGVRIGKGAVVGAGSVVNRDIPGNAIAVGVPARVVKYRDGKPAA